MSQDLPRRVGLPTMSTVRALNTITQGDYSEFEETSDPTEILFAQLVASGMNLTAAYFQAMGLDMPTPEEARHQSPRRDAMTRKPQVRKLIQRLVSERLETTALRGQLARIEIEEALREMLSDPLQDPRIKMAAIDRYGRMTHVQAFAPPRDERPSDSARSATEIYDELRKIFAAAKKD